MRIAARIKRLERSKNACGPDCPSLAVVYVGEDWYGRIGPEGEPPPCPRCGRPANVIRIVMDPNFYGNAHGLERA